MLLTSCTVADVEYKLRFGWPTGVTKQAVRMRQLWTWSSVTALIVGVLVWGLIFWACGRYYKRDGDELPRQTKYNLPLEIGYTIVPFLIIAGLFYFTVRTEDYVDRTTANPDVVLQVDAFKWNWQFEYHSYHGRELLYVNPNGAVTTNGKPYVATVGSSTEIPVLVIPRGQTVRIIEHSDDVIHSFWVPEFLFKRDVIPYGPEGGAGEGAVDTNSNPRDNQFEITPTVGRFVCRALRRAVRDLPLANELRSQSGGTAEVPGICRPARRTRSRRCRQAVDCAACPRRTPVRHHDAPVQY